MGNACPNLKVTKLVWRLVKKKQLHIIITKSGMCTFPLGIRILGKKILMHNNQSQFYLLCEKKIDLPREGGKVKSVDMNFPFWYKQLWLGCSGFFQIDDIIRKFQGLGYWLWLHANWFILRNFEGFEKKIRWKTAFFSIRYITCLELWRLEVLTFAFMCELGYTTWLEPSSF